MATDPAAMIMLSFGGSNSQTYTNGRADTSTKASSFRDSPVERYALFRLTRQKRSEGEGTGRSLRSAGGRRREGEGGGKGRGGGKGWRKKKGERAATPHVCVSLLRRHGDSSTFVTVMDWERIAPGGAHEAPTLVGDTCFNDYYVESKRDNSISLTEILIDRFVLITAEFCTC